MDFILTDKQWEEFRIMLRNSEIPEYQRLFTINRILNDESKDKELIDLLPQIYTTLKYYSNVKDFNDPIRSLPAISGSL